jgi:hypothetical protein
MRHALQGLALGLALLAGVVWLTTGAHRGWTQTTAPKKTVDDVTGIEGITYEQHFVMGLDLLGGAWLGSMVLAGVSFLDRKQSTTNTKN